MHNRGPRHENASPTFFPVYELDEKDLKCFCFFIALLLTINLFLHPTIHPSAEPQVQESAYNCKQNRTKMSPNLYTDYLWLSQVHWWEEGWNCSLGAVWPFKTAGVFMLSKPSGSGQGILHDPMLFPKVACYSSIASW